MKDDMQSFRQGVEAGYTLALEDLRQALEHRLIHKKNQEGIDLLSERSLDCADRWLEDSGTDISEC